MVGHGAIIAKAHKEVLAFAEKLQAPVVTTKLGKGIIPENHELSLGMLGCMVRHMPIEPFSIVI